jgi:hypothetical protein
MKRLSVSRVAALYIFSYHHARNLFSQFRESLGFAAASDASIDVKPPVRSIRARG